MGNKKRQQVYVQEKWLPQRQELHPLAYFVFAVHSLQKTRLLSGPRYETC